MPENPFRTMRINTPQFYFCKPLPALPAPLDDRAGAHEDWTDPLPIRVTKARRHSAQQNGGDDKGFNEPVFAKSPFIHPPFN